jgi:hypothetical protein
VATQRRKKTAVEAAANMWIQDRRERFVLHGELSGSNAATDDPEPDVAMEEVLGDEPEKQRLRERRHPEF